MRPDAADLGERARFRGLLIAAVAFFAAFAFPALGRRVFVHDDLGAFHLPLRSFYARCLKAGDRFEWCPHLYCGFDLHGEGQVGLYHPLHLLLYRALPLPEAFNLEFFLSYPLAFAGMLVLLRAWRLPRDAAALAALIFTFSGSNLFHYMHVQSVAILAHTPWILWAVHLALGPDPRRAAWGRFLVSALTASQLLLGYPQVVLFSALIEAPYAVALAAGTGRAARGLVGLAVAKGLGLLGGCIQVLPSWDAMRHSFRAAPGRDFLSNGSLHPANLMQWVAPYLFRVRVVDPFLARTTDLGITEPFGHWRTQEYGLYNGAVVPVLCLWAAIRWDHLARFRTLATVSAGLAAGALVLAFGSYTPLYDVTSRLPVVGLFRMPSRYLAVLHFATAVLAAVAFADLATVAHERPRVPARRLALLAILAALSLLIGTCAKPIAGAWPISLLRWFYASDRWIALGICQVIAATLFVVLAARGRRVGLWGLILLAAADQMVYGLTYLHHDPARRWDALVAERRLPPGPSGQRVQTRGAGWDLTFITRGVRFVDGYSGLTPLRALDYGHETSLRVAGASWIMEQPLGAAWSPVPRPLPRVRLVAHAVPTADPRRDLEAIDHETTALVDRALPLDGGPAGRAEIVRDRPGDLVVQTQAPARRLLVVAESYHEGWSARVDGVAAEVLRVNGDFLGCVVGPGPHQVALRFEPPTLCLGRSLSLTGAMLAVITLLASLAPWRRGAP